MPLINGVIRASTIFFPLLIITACSVEAAVAKPMFVEVWNGGDDGLTLRLADAIKHAFEASHEFKPSSGMKPGTLVVTIPKHVEWSQVGAKTQIFYTVMFSTADNQSIGTSTGSCFEEMFSECADKILEQAKIAARRIK